MKNRGHEYRVDARDELLDQTLNAARYINTAAILFKVTHSLMN
jgi:hypothetical protein